MRDLWNQVPWVFSGVGVAVSAAVVPGLISLSVYFAALADDHRKLAGILYSASGACAGLTIGPLFGAVLWGLIALGLHLFSHSGPSLSAVATYGVGGGAIAGALTCSSTGLVFGALASDGSGSRSGSLYSRIVAYLVMACIGAATISIVTVAVGPGEMPFSSEILASPAFVRYGGAPENHLLLLSMVHGVGGVLTVLLLAVAFSSFTD